MKDNAKYFRLTTLMLLSFFALPACAETGDLRTAEHAVVAADPEAA